MFSKVTVKNRNTLGSDKHLHAHMHECPEVHVELPILTFPVTIPKESFIVNIPWSFWLRSCVSGNYKPLFYLTCRIFVQTLHYLHICYSIYVHQMSSSLNVRFFLNKTLFAIFHFRSPTKFTRLKDVLHIYSTYNEFSPKSFWVFYKWTTETVDTTPTTQ